MYIFTLTTSVLTGSHLTGGMGNDFVNGLFLGKSTTELNYQVL